MRTYCRGAVHLPVFIRKQYGFVNSLYGSQDAEGYDQGSKRHCVANLGDGLQRGDVMLGKKKWLRG